jgi:hypothetical protein
MKESKQFQMASPHSTYHDHAARFTPHLRAPEGQLVVRDKVDGDV